jgi:hypothetical protein
MVRVLLPYTLGGLAITVLAAYAYSDGHLGVLGSYGALLLAAMVVVIGYLRWDLREHGRPPRRR